MYCFHSGREFQLRDGEVVLIIPHSPQALEQSTKRKRQSGESGQAPDVQETGSDRNGETKEQPYKTTEEQKRMRLNPKHCRRRR